MRQFQGSSFELCKVPKEGLLDLLHPWARRVRILHLGCSSGIIVKPFRCLVRASKGQSRMKDISDGRGIQSPFHG